MRKGEAHMEKAMHIKSLDDEMKLQLLDQIPTPVIAVNLDYEMIYVNESASALVRTSKEKLLGAFCHDILKTSHCESGNCSMRKAIETGKMQSSRNEVTTPSGILPVTYYAVPLKNAKGEIIGGLEYIVDISEQVKNEERLQEQSVQMSKMSTPTIKLWDGVLVLPVIGAVDSLRAQQMMESMLNKIVETSAKVILLDIQGVAAVDTAIANHLRG